MSKEINVKSKIMKSAKKITTKFDTASKQGQSHSKQEKNNLELDKIDIRDSDINLDENDSNSKFARLPFVSKDMNFFKKNDAQGVAGFIDPQTKFQKMMRQKDWAERGFIELDSKRSKLRYRILPRSVIGICFMLLAAAVGVAFSGASFYAYYDNRLSENEQSVAKFVDGFDKQFNDAAGALDDIRSTSVAQIRSELEPVEDYVIDKNAVVNLPSQIGGSVWVLETKNEDGQTVVGSAFSVVGHKGGSALATSYSLIEASTKTPSPAIEIVKDNKRIEAQLWSWDKERDIALVTVDEAIEPLKIAPNEAQVEAVGAKVFAVSGVGGNGASVSPGLLIDSSSLGLQHTSPVGTLFNGGPLVNGSGELIGLATTGYQPFGIDPGAVAQAPDIQSLCVKILQCSETSGIVAAEVGDVDVAVAKTEEEIRNDVQRREVETEELEVN